MGFWGAVFQHSVPRSSTPKVLDHEYSLVPPSYSALEALGEEERKEKRKEERREKERERISFKAEF